MKTVLLATDYSKNSVAALRYAFELARRLKARLVATHVFGFPDIVGLEGLDTPYESSESNARRHHRLLLETFCTSHLGNERNSTALRIEPVIEKSAARGIMSKANDWHAEFIVVGLRGTNLMRELVAGSTTKRLIEQAPCPVLAIPSGTVFKPIGTIIYATDFEEEDVFAIRKLLPLAESFGAVIRVVHVCQPKTDDNLEHLEWFKEILAQKVSYEALEFELLYSDEVVASLQQYVRQVDADVLVMLERKKKGFFRKWLHRDLVLRMESLRQIPLLSFREHNHQCFFA